MKSSILTFTIAILTSIVIAQSGSITNINPSQRTDGSMIIDIYYDLAGPEPDYTITLEASFDGGASFHAADSVTGDAGQNIVIGTGKHIIWSFGSEFPGQYSDQTQVRITASQIIPWSCGDTLVDPRDLQLYTTVKIGTQCWMVETMNIGYMIIPSQTMSNNGYFEKYCYNNEPANCEIYGGYYNWDEAMQYVSDTAAQGVCPPGWHIPTDFDWKVLEGSVDSYYSVGHPIWNQTGDRGYDAGTNLKSTSEWISGGNGTDLYGFNGRPLGYYGGSISTAFRGLNETVQFWTSNKIDNYAIFRALSYNDNGVYRGQTNHINDLRTKSVRCIRDDN